MGRPDDPGVRIRRTAMAFNQDLLLLETDCVAVHLARRECEIQLKERKSTIADVPSSPSSREKAAGRW